jgi:hypothetical protein
LKPPLINHKETAMSNEISLPVYTAIKSAMDELEKIPEGQDASVDALFNAMHDFYWTPCPCPADRTQRRAETAEEAQTA